MSSPIFDTPEEQALLTPLNVLTLEEVRQAAEKGTSVSIPMVQITKLPYREIAYSMTLTDIDYVREFDDGFCFLGTLRQLVTTVIGGGPMDTTLAIEGRTSECMVVVERGVVSLTFNTTVLLTEDTSVLYES